MVNIESFLNREKIIVAQHEIMTYKLTFFGHESFICKQFWLKKGYDIQ